MSETTLEFDPLSAEFRADPFPLYQRLRDEAPAYYSRKYDTWFLSRFDDIWAAERDFRHFTIEAGQMPNQVLGVADEPPPEASGALGAAIAGLDPPRHTKVRALLAPHFKPAAARRLAPLTRSLVRGFLDEMAGRGEADVVLDLAMRTSVRIACTIIGLPLEMSDFFVERINTMFQRDETGYRQTEAGMQGVVEMFGYLTELIAEQRRRGNAGDTAMGALLDSEIDGERLSEADIRANVSLMLIGGTETLPKVLSAAVYRLGQHPDQRAACVADPGLVPAAFQEALRYDMPTQMLGRRVASTWEIHGESLEPGQGVLYLWASANRDEREFPDAARFDVQRRAPRILTFGAGPHMCLGAHVARMEGEILLGEFLARIPEYEVLEDRGVRLCSELFRGWVSLPIRFPPS